jgi:hypothetical protein
MVSSCVVKRDSRKNQSEFKIVVQFGGARLLKSRRRFALTRQSRLASTLAPPGMAGYTAGSTVICRFVRVFCVFRGFDSGSIILAFGGAGRNLKHQS